MLIFFISVISEGGWLLVAHDAIKVSRSSRIRNVAVSTQVFNVMERAILSNSRRDVKRLIRDGADINAITKGMVTPTLLATNAGNLGMVKILLDAGADPCLPTPKGGDFAIHIASRVSAPNIELRGVLSPLWIISYVESRFS